MSGRTLIYSNRPPISGASGGAQAVIEAANPTWWIGPKPVSNQEWDAIPHGTRDTRHSHMTDTMYGVESFSTPKTLEDAQYITIANEILWPLAHSMQPTCSETIEEIEAAYHHGYLSHNELANVALAKAVEDFHLTNEDRIWVHDYQCANVPGMIFSNHIPWPSVDFLEAVTFKNAAGVDVPLFETSFYRDFIEVMNDHALLTFQRPIDQVNFLMTTAYIAGTELFHYASKNPLLQHIAADVRDPAKRTAIQASLLEEITLGTVSEISAFGDKSSLLNVPVGQVTEHTLIDACANETDLRKTRFSRAENGTMPIFNARIGGGNTANLTASDAKTYTSASPTLSELIEPIRGRDWIFSIHRNDYTKGTLTKLEAAEEVLAEQPNATFLFILQPTRENVDGYKEYAEKVFAKAHSLRQKYGDKSVVIIPEAVAHDDVLGLMRQPEMKGFLSLGHKDGHDLTAREIVDANDDNRPIGVMVSSGIGAADVLCYANKGGFLIQDPTNPKEVAAALREILNPKNAAMLSERLKFMKEQSQYYDAEHFCATINAAYEGAMAHRFGATWKTDFQHPGGGLFDRKGKHHPQEKTCPPYITEILERDYSKPDISSRSR